MGFSLSRAMQGAAMGAAHSAGEIFDSMIAEERKMREADAAMQRQMQINDANNENIDARQTRRDEFLERKGKDARREQGEKFKQINAKVRAMGLDPGSHKGLAAGATLADEEGYAEIANNYRARAESNRSHEANEANKRLQTEALAEQRRERREREGQASNEAALKRLERFSSAFVVDGERELSDGTVKAFKDDSAIGTVRSWYHDQLDKGVSERTLNTQLSHGLENFKRFRSDPKTAKLSPADQAEMAFDLAGYNERQLQAAKEKAARTQGTATSTPPAREKAPDTQGGVAGRISRALGGGSPAGGIGYNDITKPQALR